MAKARLAALAALSSIALFPSWAQASAGCWTREEARAAQIRGLQTMLMVGTLQCRGYNRHSVDLYNDFILNQRSLLDANATVLKAHFERETGGAEAQRAYDRYATSLANRYSAEMDDVAFCETVGEFVRVAAHASDEGLMRLAETVAAAPPAGSCTPSGAPLGVVERQPERPADRWAYVSPPPPRIAVVEAAPAPAATPAPDAKEAVIEKAVAAIAAATPASAPAPAAAPQPQGNREEALQKAIAALQTAIVALQAADMPAPQAKPASADLPITTIADSPVVPPPPPEED